MRYLVAYGTYGNGKNETEIVDISDPTKSCVLEADDIANQLGSTGQSYWAGGGTGGLLGTNPVICGGNVLTFVLKMICKRYKSRISMN